MVNSGMTIRDLRPDEAAKLGRLVVEVYSDLDDFPAPAEQPGYYALMAGIGRIADKPGARVLVALTPQNDLAGGVAYFSDMAQYGSGGTAPSLKETSGVRLLAVSPHHRRLGAGKSLTRACIDLARQAGHAQLVLHTTQSMRIAWQMYERLGFERCEDLDFLQQDLQVFGFRLPLK